MSEFWKVFDDRSMQEKEPIRHALALQILNVIGFIAVVIANALNSIGVFGDTNAVISNRYQVRFTPANYAFSVWGLIYFAAAVFVIYQAFPSQRTNAVLFKQIHVWFFFSCIFNFIWSIIFTYDLIWASAIVIALMLISLLVAYYRIGIGRKSAISLTEYWCVHFVFSIYTAWLCAATVLNWAIALKFKSDWYGAPWTEEGWAILMLGVLGVITIIQLGFRTDYAYGAVVAWAILAIGNKQTEFEPVPLAANIIGGTLAGLSFIAMLVKIFLWRRERIQASLELAKGDSSQNL